MKKNILISGFLVLLSNKLSTQTIESYKNIHNVSSPNITNIMNFSNFNSTDFIGKVDISIPIYSIKFGKIDIPIGLSYNTKGNKVADIASSVGLGWSLVAGGNITVDVKGQNDFIENYAYYTDSDFEPDFSYAWHRQTVGYNVPFNNIFDDPSNPYYLCINNRIWGADDKIVDDAPDFYHINSPGIKDVFYLKRFGTSTNYDAFFLNNPRNKLQNKNNINLTPIVRCTGFASSFIGSGGSANVFYAVDKFQIISENGYIYTFIEQQSSENLQYPNLLTTHAFTQVNTWYLNKIEDPISKNEIVFEYENNFVNTPSDNLVLSTLSNMNYGNVPVTIADIGMFHDRDSHYSRYTNVITSTKIFSKRLKRITTNNEIINFNYSNNRLDYGEGRLDNIIIKNKYGNNIIKEANFSYSYFDSNNCSRGDNQCKRLKLDDINISDSGYYIFSYDRSNFPPRNSSKTDFSGYFNNNSSDIIFTETNFHQYDNYYPQPIKFYFYPDLQNDQILPIRLNNVTPYSETVNGIDRTPSISSHLGLLRKIIYPTRGQLMINYENDDYIYNNEKYYLGSSRVKDMFLLDSNGSTVKEVNFKYINEDGKSSGIINYFTTPSGDFITQNSAGIGFGSSSTIGYSRIIEEINGKGYVEKKYSNFNDYPDKFMEVNNYNNFTQPVKNYFKFMKFPNTYIQSFDSRRGNLLSEKYFNDQSKLLKKIDYMYDYLPYDSLRVSTLFSVRNSANYSAVGEGINNLIRYYNNQKEVSTENYFGIAPIKEKVIKGYNKDRLISKKTILSDNSVLEELYKNSFDKSIPQLINANILDENIETEFRKNNILINKIEKKYDNSSNLLPTSVLSYDLLNVPTTEITYDKYDNKGNLQQYTTKEGVPISIIWGYSQTQPIAKIVGMAYDTIDSSLISSIVNASVIDESAPLLNDETAFLNILDNFRKHSLLALANAQITTYTYDPLVGVRSITPPSGIRESYIYDSANRLEKVINSEGKILKEYKYNYKQ